MSTFPAGTEPGASGASAGSPDLVKKLVVISGEEKDKGRSFNLTEGEPLRIGRGPGTILLNDLSVSRNHCQVHMEGPEAILTDLKSQLGTFLNGTKVASEQRLKSGDKIRLGRTELRFDVEDIQNAATAAGADIKRVLEQYQAADPMHQLVGKLLGHYKVGEILARGESATVFRARDVERDAAAALKVLHARFFNDDAQGQHWLRAMKPLIGLKHRNLVVLEDAGRSDGHFWVAMEWVDGESLPEMTKRVGQMDMLEWQHVLRFTMHLARALELLHKQDIVHRHVFPKNILIDTRERQAKLGALMWARTHDGGLPEPALKPGENRPELGYLAPERLRGAMGDARTDIYSLGVTVYALLTGRPPFEGRTRDETIARVMEGQPARPKEYQLALPEAFQQVVLRMLAKRPEDRYQSAAQMLAELERVAQNPGSIDSVQLPPAQVPPQPVVSPPMPAPPAFQAPSPAPIPPQPARPAQAPPGNEGRIFLTCGCGQPLKVREQFAGAPVRCPFCGNLVVVPAKNSMGQSIMAPPPRLQPDEVEAPPSGPDDLGEPPSSGVPKVVTYVVAVVLVLAGLALVGGIMFWNKGKSPPPGAGDTQTSGKSTAASH